MNAKILFTGGGSAGHVTVNLALIPSFLEEGWQVEYIGSEDGIEKQLIAKLVKVTYYGISTGKLRRYLDWKNVKDPFKVIKGVYQAYRIIRRSKPAVIFSKGGFVSVPVVLGGWLNKVPVIIHESDFTPGLANRIAMPFAAKICTTFPETARQLKSGKAEYVGAVVREELKKGSKSRGLELCGFARDKPVLLVMGGSLGSQKINRAVRDSLPALLQRCQIVHICGKGQADPAYGQRGYRQFEYVDKELPDLMAMTDMVVSRAGSNAIFEFLALRKPMLLIPLSRQASRGDQILNAQSFRKAGYCDVLEEEALTGPSLTEAIDSLYAGRARMTDAMERSGSAEAYGKVVALIRETAGTAR